MFPPFPPRFPVRFLSSYVLTAKIRQFSLDIPHSHEYTRRTGTEAMQSPTEFRTMV